DESTALVCKISGRDSFYIATAGLAVDKKAKFDVDLIVERAVRKKRTIAGKIQAAETALKREIRKEAMRLKRDRSVDYQKFIDPEQGGVTVFFGGFEGSVPQVFARRFQVDKTDPKLSVNITNKSSCPGDCPNGTMVYYGGQTKVIQSYLAKNQLS